MFQDNVDLESQATLIVPWAKLIIASVTKPHTSMEGNYFSVPWTLSIKNVMYNELDMTIVVKIV